MPLPSQASTSLRDAFGDFGGRVWLNCAHQGPLPLRAAEAAREAVAWKVTPQELTAERFAAVPARLRRALGRLLSAPPEEIALANGASYGLHLLANGLPLERGDEVLLMKGDFPSNLLPWMGLRERGVVVRLLDPRRFVLEPEEVADALSPSTRVLCLSWVHSFSGRVADLEALGGLCRRHGVRFLVNATQGIGTRPFEVSSLPVDAVVSAGWKWLCGPYATGFCWLAPELARSLRYNQAYWLSVQSAEDLGSGESALEVDPSIGARRYDVFGTANFFNFHPWASALELLLEAGLVRIAEHDRALVERLLAGLDPERYQVISPDLRSRPDSELWSTLVVISHRQPGRNPSIYQALLDAGIHAAFRRGRLRFSPHLYNTAHDVDQALEVLDRRELRL